MSDFPLTPSLLLLLAACGGGGGGGGGGRRPVLGPDDALFVETAASTTTNSVYRAVKQESAGPVRVLISGDDDHDTTTLDYYVITLFDRTEGTVRFIYENGGEILYDYTLTGADAALFEFVLVAGIGQPQRIEADDDLAEPDLVSKAPLDYENPTDQGGDNIYEFVIVYTTSDQRAVDAGLQTLRQTLILEITNNPELGPAAITPATGPSYVRDGDVISLTLDEGQTLIFVMEDVTLSQSGLSGVLADVLAGPDADDVQVRVTDNTGGLYDLMLEFSTAPEADNPADTGGDRTYDFEFSGLLADTLPLEFQVTVLVVS